MNKKIMLLPLFVASMLTGCGGGNASSGGGVLKIGCVEMGYGVKWLNALTTAFQQKTGMKVEVTTEAGQTGMGKLNTIVESGDSTYDLVFNKRSAFEHDCLVGKVSFEGGRTYDSMYVDITDVYNSKVDNGSDKTIKEKMLSNYSNYYSFNNHYYGLPWASGVIGIVRNKTLWNNAGFPESKVPVTTRELFTLCDEINESTSITAAPFIYSAEDEYYTGWLNIFLAQYKGVTEFENTILEGISPNGEVDEYFFTHDGMEETLEVIGELLAPSNNYQHPDSKQLKFTAMQSQFLSGAAFFNVNGSWLETEMGIKTTYDEIDYIKTPILSSLSKRLTIGKSSSANYIADEANRDAKLAAVVRYVDNGQKGLKPSGVTDGDIAIVAEARRASFVESGLDHQAFIPCAANNVSAAKDFLKFMYSDDGLNVYYEAMNGGTLPANPTEGHYRKDLSSTMTTFRKSINKVLGEDQIVRMQSKAKLFQLGSLNHWYSNHGIQATSRLADGGASNTPTIILQENDQYLQSYWDTIKDLVK